MSFRQELDARDYGVIADDGADQSTAIQALLDAAKTLGLPVRFPAGTFRVDTTVTYNTSGDDVKPLRLLGMGANSTIFDARVANGPAISIDGSGTSNQRARHVEIGNLRIKTTTTPTGGRGIDLKAMWFGNFHDLHIEGMDDDAIRVLNTDGDTDGSVFMDFNRCYLYGNGGWGWNQVNPTPGNGSGVSNVAFRQSYITSNAGGGVHWAGITAKFELCTVAGNTGPGIEIEYETNKQPGDIIIDRCHFDGNTERHIDAEAYRSLHVMGCQFISDDTTPSAQAVRLGRPSGPTSVIGKATIEHCSIRHDHASAATTIVQVEANVSGGSTPNGKVELHDWYIATSGGTVTTYTTVGGSSAIVNRERLGTDTSYKKVDGDFSVGDHAGDLDDNGHYLEGSNGRHSQVTASGANDIQRLAANGDANWRHMVNANGKHQWGNGTDAPDTDLERTGVGILRTGGKFHVVGELEVDGALNHDGTLAGFFAVEPVARPAAFTQTHSDVTRTHAARTAANAITDNSGGTSGGDTIASIGVDAVNSADRNDTRDAIATIAERLNELRVDQQNTAQVVNQILDDLQSLGLEQ